MNQESNVLPKIFKSYKVLIPKNTEISFGKRRFTQMTAIDTSKDNNPENKKVNQMLKKFISLCKPPTNVSQNDIPKCVFISPSSNGTTNSIEFLIDAHNRQANI